MVKILGELYIILFTLISRKILQIYTSPIILMPCGSAKTNNKTCKKPRNMMRNSTVHNYMHIQRIFSSYSDFFIFSLNFTKTQGTEGQKYIVVKWWKNHNQKLDRAGKSRGCRTTDDFTDTNVPHNYPYFLTH